MVSRIVRLFVSRGKQRVARGGVHRTLTVAVLFVCGAWPTQRTKKRALEEKASGDYERHKAVKKSEPRRLSRPRPPQRTFGFFVEKVTGGGGGVGDSLEVYVCCSGGGLGGGGGIVRGGARGNTYSGPHSCASVMIRGTPFRVRRAYMESSQCLSTCCCVTCRAQALVDTLQVHGVSVVQDDMVWQA